MAMDIGRNLLKADGVHDTFLTRRPTQRLMQGQGHIDTGLLAILPEPRIYRYWLSKYCWTASLKITRLAASTA